MARNRLESTVLATNPPNTPKIKKTTKKIVYNRPFSSKMTKMTKINFKKEDQNVTIRKLIGFSWRRIERKTVKFRKHHPVQLEKLSKSIFDCERSSQK